MARATSPSASDVATSKKGKAIDEDEDQVEEGGEEDEDEASEYEIEAIMDAKRGVFQDGRIGYFVKWKGYPSGDNSWVDENDIGGAEDLVKEFWKKHPKKSQQISAVKKKARQSTGGETSISETGKKRGRKSTAKAESEDEDADDAPSTARATKKAKKVNGATTSTGARTESPELGAQPASMPNHYAHLEDWEAVVKTVDTVERTESGELYVYFTLYEGSQVKETSSICNEKFPRKLLSFYESNLRWKAAEEED